MKPIISRAIMMAAATLLPIQPAWAAGEMTPPQANLPAAAPAPAAAGQATQSQPISVASGNGILLRLPRAAATVMSANPNIARVQPASRPACF